MSKSISIIVPVYNVKSYLKKCVDSILEQTYKNFEVLLIDDGSTDGSGELCDELAKLDSRISVFHKPNGGLSSARNKGIENAKNELLSFIDSDDYIAETFLEKLVQPFIEDESIDLSCCKFIKSTDEEKEASQQKYTTHDSEELLNIIYDNTIENISFVTWNKLYNKKLFEEVRFPERKLYEDEFTTYKTIFYSRKCALVYENLYTYRIRENSIMTSSPKRGVDCLRAVRLSMEFYVQHGNRRLEAKAAYCYLVSCVHLLKQIYPEEDRIVEKKFFKRIARKYAFKCDCSILKKFYFKFLGIF